MPADANGIWQYVSTDAASPAHTLLNRLAGSVTTVVTALKARLTALELVPAQSGLGSSPWVPFATAPFTATPGYHVVRGVTRMRGAVKNGATGKANAITVLAAPARPGTLRSFLVPANAGVAEVRVDTDGTVYVHTYYAGGTNAIVILDSIQFVAGA